MADASGSRSLLSDGLGSTIALADLSGVVQTQYTNEPFGKTTVAGRANGSVYQYTGREDVGIPSESARAIAAPQASDIAKALDFTSVRVWISSQIRVCDRHNRMGIRSKD